MRPISLQVEAFGPYLHPTTIDFEKLNEAGLFLITGSTGGGKTTLLDAMCMALYNTSTGGRRSFSDMRSLTADVDQRTEVTFTFSLGDAQYRFHRALYMRKKRGSEVYDLHELHECYRLEENEWKLTASGAARTVTEYAQRLLSLRAEQFSQVIVLPQGEFLRLLRANSKDKGEILKTLFACESWTTLVNRLGDRQKKVYVQRQELETTLQAFLQKHEAQDAAALEEQSRALAASLAETEKALAEENKTLAEAQNALQQSRTYDQLKKEFHTAEQACAAAGKRLEDAQAQAAENPGRAEQIRALDELLLAAERKKEVLRQEADRSREKMQVVQEITKTESRIRQLITEQKAADTACAEAAEKIRKGEAYLEQVNRATEALPGCIEERNTLETLKRHLQERDRALQDAESAAQALAVCQQDARQKKLAVSAQDQAIAAAEAMQRANHAAALAAALQEGEPCPVCGAVHHPAPAAGSETVLSEAHMQALRDQLENLRQVWSAAENAVSTAQTKLEICRQRLAEARAACGDCSETLSTLEQRLVSLSTEIRTLQTLTNKGPEARERVQSRRRELEQAQRTLADCGVHLASARAGLEQQKKLLADFETVRDSALVDRDLRALEQQIRTDTQKRVLLQDQQRTAEENLAAARELCAAAEVRLTAAREALDAFGPAPQQDTETVSGTVQALQVRIRTLSYQQGSLKEALDSVRKSCAAIEKLASEAAALDAVYSRIARLHGLLSGQRNSMRMPILQYVLSMMLEETIYSANRYLTIFSRGRYALRRMQAPKSGTGYSGLDIEVLDGMSGTNRSIETLSGGEQFLASLSLAFGLSEVVQANSGVVRMDSIFIDEGFGSLDGDTLDTAMKALETIRQSGRVVGIISHVSELRHRIPTMIRVSHTENGSAKATVISE